MQLEPSEVWRVIHSNAINALKLKTVFYSPTPEKNPRPYEVAHVGDDSIQILRVGRKGQESPCTLTRAKVKKMVELLNAKGGTVSNDAARIEGIVPQAIRTMMARLHPQIQIKELRGENGRLSNHFVVVGLSFREPFREPESEQLDKFVRPTDVFQDSPFTAPNGSVPEFDPPQALPTENHADVDLDAASLQTVVVVEPVLLSSEEGKRLLKVHSRIERSPELTREKKRLAKIEYSGRLICACCGFDYVAVYGSLGNDFIECHHIQPLCSRLESMETKLDDLVLVCANCHRMLHRGSTLLTVDELRDQMSLEFRCVTRGFFEQCHQ